MIVKEELLTGAAVEAALEALASLRITIFREYPYLYDGQREDELSYLRLYTAADACVVTASDSGVMVGAASGTPLCREQKEMLEAFNGSAYALDELFYVGEVLFLPAYRNCGLGLRLLERVEEHVRTCGKYRYVTCATIVRPDNHPLRPENYVPIDRFLDRTGFIKLHGVVTNFTWKENDGIKREHPMQFWVKELRSR